MNSALQRARATLRERLPERRTEWAPASAPSDEERELLRRYVEAHERADVDALAALLREDARLTMPPHPTWFEGREAILDRLAAGLRPRRSATCAASPPAPTSSPRPPTTCGRRARSEYRPLALDVLRIEDGRVAEITSFVFAGAVRGVRPPAGAVSR